LIINLSNRQLIVYGLVIAAASVVIGSVSLTYPFGRDQAFYAYAAKLLLAGKMSYLYVFDLKPPGSHLYFALNQLLLGESMFNARIFDILWQALTAYVIFLISFKLTANRLLSVLSSLLYLFLYFRQDYWHTLQADGMLNLPVSLCVLMLVSGNEIHSYIKIILAGMFFAAALIFKYTIISFLPLVLLCFLLSANEPKSIRVKNIAVFILGVVIVCSSVALWYLSKGALKDMIDIQFGQTSQYTKIAYETESGEFIFSHIIRLFVYSVYSPLIWFTFGGMILFAFKKKLAFKSMLILSWAAASLFSLIVQWKFYHYHFLVIIPSISVGSVLFVQLINDYVKQGRKKMVLIPFVIILAGFTLYAGRPYIENYKTLADYFSGKQTLEQAYIKNGFTSDSVFMFSKTLNAINYVNQYTQPNDKIFVWGYDPLIYYITGRDCVSRFLYHVPLLWKAENSHFRREFMDELNKTNPKLIITASNDPLYYISGYNEDSKQLLERFPEFKNFINSKYSFKTRINDYDFYELNTW
jgi:hypothetical protein